MAHPGAIDNKHLSGTQPVHVCKITQIVLYSCLLREKLVIRVSNLFFVFIYLFTVICIARGRGSIPGCATKFVRCKNLAFNIGECVSRGSDTT